MTEQQIILVKKTWRLLRQVDPTIVGGTFYSKLFTDHPALRKMFPKDMRGQYGKLMDMLSTIVARLHKPGELAEDIMEISKRHIAYGVKPVHFTWVGAALLWTLQQGLGNDWNEDVSNAWTECYTIVTDTMINSFSQP